MCGVAGLFYYDGRPGEEAIVRAMVGALHHRGPDDSGVFTGPGIALGHARLSIRDLSSAGRQPQSDPSGRIYVSYNGEIYNDEQLRSELSRDFGITFRTSCDTEILPAGYLAWGDKLFGRLEGMFAIAIWDRVEQKLILARDGIGIKPLYYFADNRIVRFASEIKALLVDPGQPDRLSAESLHAFFAMGYVGPHATTIDGIAQVPPGSVLTFTGAERTHRTFWRPQRRPEISTIEEASDEFARIWDQVVSDQLVSDVPIGVLQSGGIDSTLVSIAANRRNNHKTPLFAASFSDQSFDETSMARLVADRIGAELRRVPIQSDENLAYVLPKVVRHYDGQICDEASLALYLLSREVRRHVTVALSGDGGDEFFGGYPTYRASTWAARLGPLVPSKAWRGLGRIAYVLGADAKTRLPLTAVAYRFALGAAADAGHAHVYWRRYVPDFLLPQLYGPALRPLLAVDPFEGYRRELDAADGSLIDRCLVADQRWHLPAGLLMKTDAMTMAHSLEVRVPFLDRRIMDFAGRCDLSLLLGRGGQQKLLLRTVARRLGAPPAVVGGSKRGFNSPLASFLRCELRPMAARAFEADADLLEPFLQPSTVRQLWREHLTGKRDHAYTLWPILTFAIWRGMGRPSAYGGGQSAPHAYAEVAP